MFYSCTTYYLKGIVLPIFGESNMNAKIFFVLLAILAMVAGCTNTEQLDLGEDSSGDNIDASGGNEDSDTYNPTINPADFSADITNKYFRLTPRTKWIYQGQTEDGLERIEYYVTEKTRVVMGVPTRIVWDRVWLDGELIEETFDWYTQDKEGNVWYFGEETYEVFDGEIENTNGAWEAGKDGALPGIMVKADPKVGDSYYQEYYVGQAEDRGDVLSLTETVSVPLGTLKNCMKTRDYNPLAPDADEHKYYCPEVGSVALEVSLEDGERVELISVEHDVDPSPGSVLDGTAKSAKTEEPEAEETTGDTSAGPVTEEEAVEIALERVPGEATDVARETKSGKRCYAVEIQPEDGGPETDVFVEIATGKIIAVED
jgi:hypothetical protein